MNLRHMEVFRAVMLTGGVSGAAQLLHVSQPAISKLLAQAARHSGLTLFERVRGRLVPTPEAQQLYEEIEILWRGLERVRDVSRGLAHPSDGSLRLAVSASLAPYLAPQAMALLYAQFPQLKTRVEILVPSIMVDALLDQSVHLGVCLLPNEHPNLVTVKSYQCGLACVMPEGHPLAARQLIRPQDLVGHRVIASPASTLYGQTLQRSYGAAGPRLQIDMEVRSAATACWFAQAGNGIAVVDQAAVAVADQAIRGLVVRPFQARERLGVSIIRHRYRPLSVVQKAFCQAFDTVWKNALG
ncbi:LysR substrate-binding domain-containing protein [Variovorax terrae]|uniref:LysR substrate-binding domain-containing protein n=1 Tax=Variovorax terrae TaxID=2923278 RepID=A0A9X1W034_9BURK|nr:LysR substrate-binding domain-containing protein [Variovorax terrae]MCJ0765242.1 LysR substrate-binding domain-containing protein [Variovorax terrae]